MNEEQAFAIIRNIIRLENRAKELARTSTRELRQAINRVRQIISNLPEGSIERELAYKELQGVLRAISDIPAAQLTADIRQQLPEEAGYQASWGQKYLDNRPGDILDLQAAAVEGIGNTQVLNQAVEDITGPLSTAQWRRIDKKVRAGFLGNLTNKQIADEIGSIYKASKSELRAIARTAVMSMAQETHNAIWDANDDVIVGWVWDASMDFRVCPICAPLDGIKKKKRSDFPKSAPAHPNCRCMILPRTDIEPPEGDRSIIELRKDKPAESANVRVYKNKVRGKDGKMYWKVVTDVGEQNGKALTMGGFLRRANNVTQESVLGKGRAKRFRELIKGTPGSRAPLSPEEALIRVTKT